MITTTTGFPIFHELSSLNFHHLEMKLSSKNHSLCSIILMYHIYFLPIVQFVQEVKPHGQGKGEGGGDYFGTKSKVKVKIIMHLVFVDIIMLHNFALYSFYHHFFFKKGCCDVLISKKSNCK